MEQSEHERYDPAAVEERWQAAWAAEGAFTVPNPDPAAADTRLSTYVLEMLPYPSGELHMGHVFNYTMGDVLTHIRRRQGMTVLRPMGYDAFGLPAENAAIREGGHPREITNRNIESIRRQMKRMGWAIDWSREVSTAEPEYYRWTQWLFLRFFEKGLAYRREAPVKWCPKDQTVLANEQVIDGRCERCGTEVESRNLTQWFFKITEYADALLDETALLESWPEKVLTMQRNWIGRSEGARVIFTVQGSGQELPVFTTRPDTLFGATFFVLAPEHPLVTELTAGTEHEDEVAAYVAPRGRALRGRARGEGEGRRLHRPLRGQPGERRADPDLGRRLRLDGVRDGRDHGRPGARRARPRVRGALRPRDPAGRRARRTGRGLGGVGTGGRRVRRAHGRRGARRLRWVHGAARPPRASGRSRPGWPSAGWARRRSATACATGCSPASATGAARSRSCTASRAAPSPCRTTSYRCACPRSRTTRRRAAARSPRPRTGSRRHARAVAARPGARPTRWTPSSTRPGTSCATPTRGTTTRRGTRRSSTTGCRSRSTSAGSSTRSCTCCTRGSSRRC